METKISIGLLLVFCAAWQAHAAVTCTAAGRFADTSDTTCQNYTLCVYNNSTGTYLAYNYTCPTTSVFSPTISQCTASSNYVCNNTSTTSSTNSASVCTADGYFADPSSTNCSSYIECVEINGAYTETTYTCPTDTYFNPNTTLCESDYNCTTTSTFNCTAAGRFADTTDTTCQAYFFCVYDSSTTSYIQYNYTCPSTSLFNPNTALCTASYTCTN
ncbi:nuclear pore complex protein DDB_G0274915-like [Plodia interpunctella]|uniref:nuclear pore complex protein DDB_G0274915-like n=1 Tax=Plodia interpunctella TaxID=58824 RepID=UPI0023687DAC|nr:nuclear pore complex protein DDB_G0274915-like [Plodia interpunctella]